MAKQESNAKVTTDHRLIRKWVEARGGHPATVKRTRRGDEPGVLRIDYPGYSGEEALEPIELGGVRRQAREKSPRVRLSGQDR